MRLALPAVLESTRAGNEHGDALAGLRRHLLNAEHGLVTAHSHRCLRSRHRRWLLRGRATR